MYLLFIIKDVINFISLTLYKHQDQLHLDMEVNMISQKQQDSHHLVMHIH